MKKIFVILSLFLFVQNAKAYLSPLYSADPNSVITTVGGGTKDCIPKWQADGSYTLITSTACLDSAGELTGLNAIRGLTTLEATTINSSSLTASMPVKTDALKNLVSGAISLTSDVSGVTPEANGGTNADLSGVSPGALFYQSSAATMGQLIGYTVNGYYGINAINSKTVADPGAPTTSTQNSYQLNLDVSSAGGNLNQNIHNVRVDFAGSNDLASLNNAEFDMNINGASSVGSVNALGYAANVGDGTNAGSSNFVTGLYGNVQINDNYTATTVKVNDINASLGTGVTNTDFIGQNYNFQISSPITNSFVAQNNGMTFNAGASLNNVTMVSAYPTFNDTVTGSAYGFSYNPTHGAASNGTTSFYSNPQFNAAATSMTGLYVGGNGTSAPGSYIGAQVQSNFAGTGTTATAYNASIAHDVTGDSTIFSGIITGNGNNLYGNSLSILGDATLNLLGSSILTSGNGTSGTGYYLNSTGTFSNNFIGYDSDVSGVTVTGGDPVSYSSSGGVLNFNSSKQVGTGGGLTQGNLITMAAAVPGGGASSSDYIGTNMPLLFTANDDHTAGGFGLGIASVGYVSTLNVAAGKTVAKISNAASAFNDTASGAGSTVTDAAGFRSLGALTTGGTVGITNLSHFKAESNPIPIGTNIFGVNIEDTSAENYFSKSIVIGGAANNKVSNSDVALEIASLKAFKLSSLTTVQKNGLTPLESMFLYDNVLKAPSYYNGTAWVQVGAASSLTLTPNTGLRTDNTGLVESVAQTDGQILIGSTGTKPQAATLTATANQTTVTNGAGTITIGTVQDIGTSSSPQFTGLNVSGLTASRPVKTDGSKNLVSGQIDLSSINEIANTLGETNGGTGQSTYTTGDMLYASAANTLSKRAAGTNGYVLTMVGGVPDWAAAAATGITSLNSLTASSQTFATNEAASDFTISSSTSTHTFSLPDASTTARGVVNRGSQQFAGQKDFTSAPKLSSLTASRPLKLDASNVATATQIDLSSTNDVANALGATNGGTGQSTYTTGDILYASAANTLSKRAAGADGRFLQMVSGVPQWSTAPVGSTSYVRVNASTGTPGRGSTNTTVRYYPHVAENSGTDITYTSSTTNGDSFTINTPGVYHMSMGDGFNTGGQCAITKNGTELSTSPNSFTSNDTILAFGDRTSNVYCSLSANVYLQAGDVIRAQVGTDARTDAAYRTYFEIAREVGDSVATKSLGYAEITGSTAADGYIPADDTIPQITEGTEIFSKTITPTRIGAKIHVSVNVKAMEETNTGQAIIIALFKDSNANAVMSDASGNQLPTTNLVEDRLIINYTETVSSLSSITYSVRIGGNSNPTDIVINESERDNDPSDFTLGNTINSWMKITEENY